MKCSLGISDFLEEISSPSLFIVFLYFFAWTPRKAFLSLLAVLWNFVSTWIYLAFSPLPLASLLFSAICKAASDNHFAFLHFFFLGMVLITASCTMLQTSVHSFQALSLSDLISWIYLPLQGIWFRSYLNGLVVFSTFFNLSLNLAIWSSWSEPQLAPGLFCWLCRAYPF